MHHTVAWRESIAQDAENDVTPVVDGTWTIQNGHFLPQANWLLQYAYFGSADSVRARLITPSFRQITNPWIRPINNAIVPLNLPNIADYRSSPLLVRGLEELEFHAEQTAVGAAVVVGLAGLSRGVMTPAPQGDVYTMRGTGTTTVGVGLWTNTAITWQDTLPAGLYSCVGLEAVSVTGIGARLVFEDQVDRPGCLAQSLTLGGGPEMFRKGGLGVWGRFDANRMPNVEFLCNAADTAQEVFLDFVRVR